jgi:hypothetical protein
MSARPNFVVSRIWCDGQICAAREVRRFFNGTELSSLEGEAAVKRRRDVYHRKSRVTSAQRRKYNMTLEP